MKNSVKNYFTPGIRSYEIVPGGILCQSFMESLDENQGSWVEDILENTDK